MGEKGTVPFKSLAPWKTWWGSTPVAHDLACSVKECIDPTKIPGGGVFLSFNVSGKVTGPDLQDGHSARVLEGILRSYPAEKDPSAYLLGDSLLHLNDMLGGCIFGPHAPNPINEKCRREKILKEGTKMKQLLSYVRASSGRTDKGRSATVTFLKELALSRGRPKRSKSASPSTCSTLSATTMVLGEEPTSSSSRSSGASVQSIQDIQHPSWKNWQWKANGFVGLQNHSLYMREKCYTIPCRGLPTIQPINHHTMVRYCVMRWSSSTPPVHSNAKERSKVCGHGPSGQNLDASGVTWRKHIWRQRGIVGLWGIIL